MLDTLRSASQTWIAKLLMAILVISFGVWGISDVFRGGTGSDDVLAAGDATATIADYQIAYDREMNYYSQQYGQRLTRDQARQIGVDNQVLAQLVAGIVLDVEARRMQLGLSEDRLARLTADDPAFHGPDGKFNRQFFTEVLRQMGLRPQDYFDNRKKLAVRQQIVEAATDGISIPNTLVKALALYQGESRTVDYVTLSPSIVGVIADPSDADLKTYFDANKARYRAPEYRKITYVPLRPQDIADPAAITADQVAKAYDQAKGRFTTPEKRTIEQLSFANDADAKAALDKIKGGTATFDDIAKAQGKSQSDITLGTYEKSALPDAKVADAAFSLKQGEVSGVVDGSFGPVLLRVTQITPETVAPLAQVGDKLREQLALKEASSSLLDIHDAYEDARSGGATMAEAAAKEKLKPVTITVDAQGQSPDGSAVKDIPDQPRLLKGAFNSEAGSDNDPISLQPSGFLWYQVNAVTPARDRTLAEVHDKVVADWKDDQRAKRLAAKADEVEKKVKAGGALQDIAKGLGIDVQTKRGVTRETKDGDLDPIAVGQLFDGANGHTGVADAASGGGKIVFKVTGVEEPANTGPDSLGPDVRKAFASRMSDDLLDQLVARLQTQYPVTVNRAAIERAQSF
jgi:peptidyl-prolyl cis-trans isomerase D